MVKQYAGYLIDLDGTVYFGNQRIKTAEAFIHQLLKKNIPFLIVTNNATRTPQEVAQKLKDHYGLDLKADHIYASSLAMVDYLVEHHPNQSVFVVGEPSFKQILTQAGIQIVDTSDAQVVVQALDRQVTYQQLAKAATAIRNGATFLVTNRDRAIPTEKGMMPSSGAITAFLSYTTGVEPLVMGKPNSPILEGALKRLGLNKDEVLVIGDNYETDITLGIKAGIDSLLVLTGVTSPEQAKYLQPQPRYILNDLSEWQL